MYCSKCGRRLTSDAVRCPECGADANPEYCGGFWGLTGGAPKPEGFSVGRGADGAGSVDRSGMQDDRELMKSRKDAVNYRHSAEKWEKKYATAGKRFRIVVLVLIILLLSQMINGCVKKNKIEDLTNNTVSKEEYNKLQEENQQLKSEIEENRRVLDARNDDEAVNDQNDQNDREETYTDGEQSGKKTGTQAGKSADDGKTDDADSGKQQSGSRNQKNDNTDETYQVE